MTTFSDLKKELKNKERSVQDLIRFIETRTDNNPNYSLLLGAGCSVTSNIRSANTLIKEWKKEIYLLDNDTTAEDYSEDMADKYLSKKMWYDSRNPYSSLFERRYDLPRQRRMFIEQEVRNKLPSIGYAYLIKLVENNFFKTLFTTNFDDLLNESFYQYSSQRPILCAHDSAINSITVTSKRPKIIKLHGDYLFDDIKSTLRETESLEENIKNKFIEFAKDYGLIVIGYGGADRSIVDILTYLLKNEDYFKNGIYWCLREGSEISEDLRKLLWKERVYYVKITGFDELMAEINSKLNNSILPIDSSYLNEKKNKIIEELVGNPYLSKTDSEFIISDFEKLNKTRERDIISGFFRYISGKDDKGDEDKSKDGFEIKESKYSPLSELERKNLMEIRQELFSENYDLGNSMADEYLKSVNINSEFYNELIDIKAKSLRKLGEKSEAVKYYKKLLKRDSGNSKIKNYLILSNLVESHSEKIELLDKAIEIDPFYDRIYNQKARLLYTTFKFAIDTEVLNFDLDFILSIINKSIEVNPSVNNSIWTLRLDVLKAQSKDNKEYFKLFEEFFPLYEIQDSFHPKVVESKVDYFKLKKEKDDIIINYLLECIDKSYYPDYKKYNEFELLNFYFDKNKKDELKVRLNFIENKYIIDDEYYYLKSRILFEKFDNLSEAIFFLRKIKDKKHSTYERLFDYLLFQENFDEAEIILKNNLNNNDDDCIKLHAAKGEFLESLRLIEKVIKTNSNDLDNCLHHSFYLLKLEKYQEAYNKLNRYLKPSNFTDPYLLINYFIASNKFKRTNKIDKIKEKLLRGQQHDDIIKAAAYALINDSKNAYINLSKAINKDYSYKYKVRNWVVFETLLETEKFKNLLGI